MNCQICNTETKSVFFLGWLPPVNVMTRIGDTAKEEPRYPAELFHCSNCQLVQMGCEVPSEVNFPLDYAYRSRSTKILRENFDGLARECTDLGFVKNDCDELVIDIGSNDGTALSYFRNHGCKVVGVEPTRAASDALQKGIFTYNAFFDKGIVRSIVNQFGKAKVITACNVFAHIPDPNLLMENVLELLDDDGVFVTENHYLPALLKTLQYDTIYHEHLRYYSFEALEFLFEKHGLYINTSKPIPTHGGSIRCYASRTSGVLRDKYHCQMQISEWGDELDFASFNKDVMRSKLELLHILAEIKRSGGRIFGIGAPSRATTLINYCGLDHNILDCVCEISSSPKIGNYVPGSRIPIVDERELYEKQPEYALLLSWHIADELMPKIIGKGYEGRFVVPLPNPRVV